MRIDDFNFEVSTLLGKAEIAMSTYSELQVGDILLLEQNIDQGLITKVGSTECFRSTAGLFETHKAITIDERILL